jgi:hypothetical protein
MKTSSRFIVLVCAAALLLSSSGCVAAIGNREPPRPTIGQQLIDLQKAKDAGAISDVEFQAQRAKVLAQK